MEEFDVYYRWLGIPPEEQPPSHYRLLGLPLFEEDLEVIANCADRQRSFVKRQSANVKKFEAVGQKILNEIEAARICLMTPEKRQAYNEKLRSQLLGQQKATPSAVLDESIEISSRFIVGSGKSCDLVIKSRGISSMHCSIVKSGNRVIIRDLQSTNGTTVNLKTITKPTEIIPSDLILLGKRHRMKLPDTIFTNVKPNSGFAILGRNDQCEIPIDDSTISAFHARCVFDENDTTIEDFNSTNGTFLIKADGQRQRLLPHQPISLKGSEAIYLGKHRVSIEKLLSDLQQCKVN